jgi:hypothetical protein
MNVADCLLFDNGTGGLVSDLRSIEGYGFANRFLKASHELTLLHQTFCKKAADTLRHLEAKRGKAAVHEALEDAAETDVEASPIA